MIGRISYVNSVLNTPATSPFQAVDIFALEDVFRDVVAIGQTQDIVFSQGYSKLDLSFADVRNLSQSASGVVEVTHFLSTKSHKFTIPYILEARYGAAEGLAVSEYSILLALGDECAKGTVLTWYKAFDDYPTEYISCVANNRPDPIRTQIPTLWDFSFDFLELPTVQVPSTIPPFV